ncbi:gluconate:H+ symporter [Lactococcus garvieae]|jgi:GntP family gluconate:H+ symporter|uniref:Gluconate transporter protein n=1 Tax=Lactococcus garvieae (strain Lg2) TaxID=420890 RepID=F9VEI5_LACGL|nr:gluconate:H+ symporter [Lactococcus garvieae]EOT33159.1 GntP family gluconate:H+ symporter [Lactococcus garvieae ATCC 49156]EOT93198.1 GntP family gluconate:H+ symporter [Lactococcus garvieae ATCC 49156]MCI3861525.1 gluconate:H+ symporter [Lactococcus garvieae]MCO7128457.1 gluconate:H+ symporter [Lactococcus garvieae]QSQ97672.1 gluconate permease [Lactococcus garvieae]
MDLLIVLVGVLILLFLIGKAKLNTFVSLVIVSFIVAMLLGIDLAKIPASIETGIGGQLGHLGIIFGFGAMLGRLVSDAGGAYRIAHTLIDKFGNKRIQLAVVLASFIIGIALFFEVGMVLLIPIIFAIAAELAIPILYLGIPMVAALSVAHGFLPPHPGPTAIAGVYGANMGLVLLYGFIIAVPTVLIAGPLFTKFAKKMVPDAFSRKGNLSTVGEYKEFKLEETPSFLSATLTSLMPVLLMAISTLYVMVAHGGKTPKNPSALDNIVAFIGSPDVAMLLSLLIAIFTMGIFRKIPMKRLMASAEASIKQIAMMLLIIGGGGAFKQVLIDGGVGDSVAQIFQGSRLSPLILAWLIAVVLRLALGSATVAALTAAGLVLPLMAATGTNPALLVIATGAGSLFFSHVNDAGFWMFKEYFNLTVKETLLTWSLLETLIAIVGLVGALILNVFV